jgi:hypothetical protein
MMFVIILKMLTMDLKYAHVARFLRQFIKPNSMQRVDYEQIKDGIYDGIGIYPKIFMKCNQNYFELMTYVQREHKGNEYLVPLRIREKLNGQNLNVDHLQLLRDNLILQADRIRLNFIPDEYSDVGFVKIEKY